MYVTGGGAGDGGGGAGNVRPRGESKPETKVSDSLYEQLARRNQLFFQRKSGESPERVKSSRHTVQSMGDAMSAEKRPDLEQKVSVREAVTGLLV